MTFYNLTFAAAVLCAVLSAVLIFFPEIIYWVFTVPDTPTGDFLAIRAGMVFLGVSVILWGCRNEGASTLRSTISIGVIVMMAGLAVAGVYEFLRGFAGLGIWVAILIELGFAYGYLSILRKD